MNPWMLALAGGSAFLLCAVGAGLATMSWPSLPVPGPLARVEPARAMTDLAAQSLQAEQWNDAMSYLYQALEAGTPASQAHYRLAFVHAKLGNRRHGVWHYLAYLELANLKEIDPEDEPLRALRALPAGSEEDAASDARVAEADELAGQGSLAQALSVLKRLAQQAPWSADVCERIARLRAARGESDLARRWRERAELARRVAADRRSQERVEQLLAE